MTPLVLRAAMLIDGTGAEPASDAQVVIERDRIVAVGPQAAAPVDAEIVEYGDATIMPGLVNAHVHLELDADSDMLRLRRTHTEASPAQRAATAVGNAQLALATGVTTLRDCGGYMTGPMEVRDHINAGRVVGPRVYASGAPITTTGGHLAWCGLRADTTDEVVRAARRMVEAGADFIKVMATGGGITPESNYYREQYDEPTLRALVADAHRVNKRVAAHVHASNGCVMAIDAGVDTIEHCSWMLADGRRGFDGMDAQAVDRLDPARQWINTTLAGLGRAVVRDLHDLDTLPGAERDELRAWGKSYRYMGERGAPIALSDDAGVVETYFHEFPLTVIAAQVALDLTPVGAIHRATQVTAAAIGVDDQVGSLQAGRLADILVVGGDASANICRLSDARAVYLGGREVSRDGRLRIR